MRALALDHVAHGLPRAEGPPVVAADEPGADRRSVGTGDPTSALILVAEARRQVGIGEQWPQLFRRAATGRSTDVVGRCPSYQSRITPPIAGCGFPR
jgi:hypothetical protein